MDVDVGIVGGSAAAVDGFNGAEQMERGLGNARKAVQKQFIPVALMICTGVLCAPCYFLYAVLLGPICRPFSVALFKIFECLGCVTILPVGDRKLGSAMFPYCIFFVCTGRHTGVPQLLW